MGEYERCAADCDTAVDKGREARADYKIIARALTRKGNALARLDRLEDAILTYQKSLTEHRSGTLDPVIHPLRYHVYVLPLMHWKSLCESRYSCSGGTLERPCSYGCGSLMPNHSVVSVHPAVVHGIICCSCETPAAPASQL